MMANKIGRVSYDSGCKRKVILHAENHGNGQAARGFGVAESNIWSKHKAAIFACKVTRKTLTGPHKGRHPELDVEVSEFIQEIWAPCN